MRNMPKVIGTGKDIFNLLGMVQAGKLEAEELKEAIRGIEEEMYIFSPIISISEDKRYVTTNYLAEARKEAKLVCAGETYTIKSVEHITKELEAERGAAGTEQREERQTVIGVDADLDSIAGKVGIESPVSVLEWLGITQEDLNSVKGVLAKYE